MSDTSQPEQGDQVDWEMTTFAGARREQLRRWSRLSLRQIVLALEEMEELGKRLGSDPGAMPPE